MSEYYIGQIFENEYPIEAADWCNASQSTDEPARIDEIEPIGDITRYQIVSTKPTEKEIKQRRINELQDYLNSTDWYSARYIDNGVPIPDGVKAARQAAREEIERLREELEPDNSSDSDTSADSNAENSDSDA